MRRLLLLPVSVLALTVIAAACGEAEGAAIETLPAINTTTTTSTTTTTPDMRRRFYEVVSGDNLSRIARSFEVPRREIVRLNNLPDDGAYLEVGQILEIPTDMVLITALPTSTTTTDP